MTEGQSSAEGRGRTCVLAIAVWCFLAVGPGRAESLLITTFAGPDEPSGASDGAGSDARFKSPYGVAVDGSGNVYIADAYNHTIRKITPAGMVSTLAGLAGHSGNADGTGSAAQFDDPIGVAVDVSGTVYVADTSNNTIRKITSAGVVSSLAGLRSPGGSTDGTGSAARFNSPAGLAVDNSGNVYVTDRDNHTIRKITPGGVVSTWAGLAGSSGSTDGTGSAARFHDPAGLALDGSGNVYVGDSSNNTVRKIAPGGVVSTLAGLAGSQGSADGAGSTARFFTPWGVAADGAGNVYVSDRNNNTLRQITPAGVVSTLAGLAGTGGNADGTGSAARFSNPVGVALDGSANVYVADTTTCVIRKVTLAGVVSTIAGPAGNPGSVDGAGVAARFNWPYGVAVDGSGCVYVADRGNYTIRKITPGAVVSTLAGLAGSAGSANGTGSAARFNNPLGVAVDGSGNVYVADQLNFTIRKITPAGAVSTLAGLAGISGSTDGTGSTARFNHPFGVAVDGSGNIYVADLANCTIRRVTPAGLVSTVAGSPGAMGSTDGVGATAHFDNPGGVAVDGSGNVYVADTYNFTIRKGSPSIADVATIDQASGVAGATRQLDTNPQTASAWQWSEIRVPASSAAALNSTTVRSPAFTPDVAGLYVFRLVAADASGNQSISTVQLLVAAKIGVETAANGGGTVVPAQTVNAGNSITVWAIARDDSNNFMGNVAATWSLLSKTGGVVDSDLVASGDAKRATFTGNVIGTVVIDAASGGWTKTDSGTITVNAGTAAKIRVETAADGSGMVVPAQTVNSGNSNTVYAITRDASNNFVANVAATWSLLSKTGGVVDGDLVASGDTKSATFTGHVIGTAVIDARSGLLAATDSGTITVTAAKIRVETAADGSGMVVPAQTVNSGNSITVYAITRDASNNFVANVAATWSLLSKTGGVVDGDLVASGDTKSATFSGHVIGTAVMDAASGSLTKTDSGTITVAPGPAATLAVSGFPNPGTAGTAGSFSVTALDASGNTALGYTGTVHFTSSDSAAVLPSDYAFVSGDNGIHSFSATLKTAGTQSITATDNATVTITGTQSGITVNPGPLAQFSLALSSPQANGAAFTGVNRLTAQDAYDNTVTTFDASADNVKVVANAPLMGDVYGLGTGNNNVLNRATDFVAGVADLTALGMKFVGNYAAGTFTATSATGKSGTSGSVTINGPGPGQPGKDMQVVAWLTIPASVSIAWGDGTTGKTAGEITPLDWTVKDAGGDLLGQAETCASNDANNNMAMNLENTSNTGTKARVFAGVANSGGWNIAGTPATDTFAIKTQLGANQQVALAATAQELTGTATLAKGADQPLVLTVMTPTAITQNAGVQKTIFVTLTAAPE